MVMNSISALFSFDIALLLGATLRLIRLVLVDDLGIWFIQNPAQRWRDREKEWGDWREKMMTRDEYLEKYPTAEYEKPVPPTDRPAWVMNLVSGTTCRWCIGFWLGALALFSLALVGGPGDLGTMNTIWRYAAGALALNWLAAHIGVRAGDRM